MFIRCLLQAWNCRGSIGRLSRGCRRSVGIVVSTERKYDSHRAAGLLAHAYANTGEPAKAEALFEEVTRISTLSETYYNYASLLAEQHRTSEAREWSQRILAKKPTMPGYLRRRERPWFRKANGLLKRLAALK